MIPRRRLILGHAPQPGPLYWDSRCTVCGWRVDWHALPLARLRHRIRLARRFR